MGVEVRAPEREALPGIVAIYNHYVLTTAATFDLEAVRVADREAWFHEHTAGGRHRLLVATRDGQLIGWSTSSPFRPRPAYATTVEVSVYCGAGETGRGVGSALYRHLFDQLRGEDIERLVAGVALPNPASVALHRRFGFSPVGVFSRVGRKFGRYWDVRWYERPLRLPDGFAPEPAASASSPEGVSRPGPPGG